jgi:hypothetical protein
MAMSTADQMGMVIMISTIRRICADYLKEGIRPLASSRDDKRGCSAIQPGCPSSRFGASEAAVPFRDGATTRTGDLVAGPWRLELDDRPIGADSKYIRRAMEYWLWVMGILERDI